MEVGGAISVYPHFPVSRRLGGGTAFSDPASCGVEVPGAADADPELGGGFEEVSGLTTAPPLVTPPLVTGQLAIMVVG